MTFRTAASKMLQTLMSWKFQLLVLSTWLFYTDKLSELGWLTMAASTTGLRELINLLTLRMGAQTQVTQAVTTAVVVPEEMKDGDQK